MNNSTEIARTNQRTARRLLVVVVAMFGFGYALVPLYNVFCEITGLNGKTGVVHGSRSYASPLPSEYGAAGALEQRSQTPSGLAGSPKRLAG